MSEGGARLDECLDALEALWTTNPAEYHGEHWSVPANRTELTPVQKAGPPIYLAGFAPAAQRRIARRADGWLPVHRPGTRPFDPEKTVIAPLARLRQLPAQEGRDQNSLGTVLRVYPVAGASIEECAEVLRRAEQDTETEHAFVDPAEHRRECRQRTRPGTPHPRRNPAELIFQPRIEAARALVLVVC